MAVNQSANQVSKLWWLILALVIVGIFYLSSLYLGQATYNSGIILHTVEEVELPPKPLVKHLPTPVPLKGVYMTACVAGTPSFRDKVVKLVAETELNALIIDIKDYTGTISFTTDHPLLEANRASGCKVADLKEFIATLHDKNIYVIGRITVFQDPYYANKRPDLAVKRASDGGVWKDRKGISFIDVGAREYWDYIVALSEESFKLGFDELNFDYIRYPSDGNMQDIAYDWSEGRAKPVVLEEFFAYLDTKLKDPELWADYDMVPVTSADLFGMTTTNTDDLNIGQILEKALPYFDYIAPMVYPSHYPPQFNGWPDPNKVPYEIIHYSMTAAVKRVNDLRLEIASTTASTTPKAPILSRLKPSQLRPWLQDNDYPVPYTPDMVRAQIKATYDAGLDSWMLWDAGNTYTWGALLAE